MANGDHGQEVLSHLDTTFDHRLTLLKPFYLSLISQHQKHLCNQWIRKLSEQETHSIDEKERRNQYCMLLYDMLWRNAFEEPFSSPPPDGKLPELKSPLNSNNANSKGRHHVPDWLEDGRGDIPSETRQEISNNFFDDSLLHQSQKNNYHNPQSRFIRETNQQLKRTTSPYAANQSTDQYTTTDDEEEADDTDASQSTAAPNLSRPFKSTPHPDNKSGDRSYLSAASNYCLAKPGKHRYTEHFPPAIYPGNLNGLDNSSLQIDPQRTRNDEHVSTLTKLQENDLVFTTIDDLERKTALLQAKFHEELLNLSRQHDQEVKGTIERKNREAEEIRSDYESQLRELEETSQMLERKVRSLTQENSTIREEKDNEIEEVKQAFRQTAEMRQTEVEQKIHTLMAEFEAERKVLVSQQRTAQQELMKETQSCITKMEQEYEAKKEQNANNMRELQNQLDNLTRDKERLIEERKALNYENQQLVDKLSSFQSEMEELKQKYLQLEEQYHHNINDHEAELRALKQKHEATLSHARNEREIVESRVSDTISELNDQVDQLRRTLRSVQEESNQKLNDKAAVWRTEKASIENCHLQKIRDLQTEHDNALMETKKEARVWQLKLEEAEEKISTLETQLRRQNQRHEENLADQCKQIEVKNEQTLEDWRRRVDSAESETARLSAQLDVQRKDSERKINLLKEDHQRELDAMKTSYEKDKEQFIRDKTREKEKLLAKHESDLDKVRVTLKNELNECESRWSSQSNNDRQKIESLESQVRALKAETCSEAQLRKQQLVELGLLREEEKNAMSRKHEAEMQHFRREFSDKELAMQKRHAEEIDAVLNKTNKKLSDIEEEYESKIKKLNSTINELESKVLDLRHEKNQFTEDINRKLSDQSKQHEEELNKLRTGHCETILKLERELEYHMERTRELEEKILCDKEIHQSQLYSLRENYESRVSGLMPASVQRDLEDTIVSLNHQIKLLQQRVAVLSEEVDSSYSFSYPVNSGGDSDRQHRKKRHSNKKDND